MGVVAPPEPPRPDELEALSCEARARRRKRWLGAAAAIALLAGGVLAVYSIASRGSSRASRADRGTTPVKGTKECGIRVAGPRILDSDGKTVYREPLPAGEVHPDSIPSQVRCSGSTVWVVWDNGAGMMKEDYVGSRSGDGGRTWRLVFAESFFGMKAPHELDAYFGPWTLRGPEVAYFVGSCPACSAGTSSGTVSLAVTKNGGRTFRRYRIPALNQYAPVALHVSGRVVTIVGNRVGVGVSPHKTASVRVH
jgi:hypothetical protein